MSRQAHPETRRARVIWRLWIAGAVLQSFTAGSALAFPGSAINCSSCHVRTDGEFHVLPQVVDILQGDTREILFNVTYIPAFKDTALALAGIDVSGLRATVDSSWNVQQGGAWLTSPLFDMPGAIPLSLTIGADATPGSYPVRVTMAGTTTGGFADLWSTSSDFTINVLPSEEFQRGDCNADGQIDISDAVFILGTLFLGDGNPGCDDACDSNDDGILDLSDAVFTLSWKFLGGPAPPEPKGGCGADPTGDELRCDLSATCQ